MSPIVSPWWFYLFDIVENLDLVCGLIFGIWGICWGAYALDSLAFKKEKPKLIKTTIAIVTIFSLITIFTPSKKTCYQMVAATLVTPDNISVVGETTKNAIDYIVESVDKVLDEDDD
jgi:hypothetical protein